MKAVIQKGMALNESIVVEFSCKDGEDLKLKGREALEWLDQRAHELNMRTVHATAATKSAEVIQEVQHVLGILQGRMDPSIAVLARMAEDAGVMKPIPPPHDAEPPAEG